MGYFKKIILFLISIFVLSYISFLTADRMTYLSQIQLSFSGLLLSLSIYYYFQRFNNLNFLCPIRCLIGIALLLFSLIPPSIYPLSLPYYFTSFVHNKSVYPILGIIAGLIITNTSRDE